VPSLSFAAPLLAIEASTTVGSVALWLDGALAGVEVVPMGVGREDRLFPAMQHLLEANRLSARVLQSVVCGEGPGSFTSLRIAASLAKGLAHGTGCALYAVPSLLVAAATASPSLAPGRYLVHADALRGERYVLPVERSTEGGVTPSGPLARISSTELEAAAGAAGRVAVCGSPFGDELCVVEPSVGSLSQALGRWRDAAVSLEGWEPVYGRLAEAQVKWEASHGMPLPDTSVVSS
jgi:tRNA threonylcarbamoyladenosine biosynthesis protein TsaB